MGCRCCRMLQSYIYDPSVPVDVHGHKRDPAESSLYQSHSLPEEVGRGPKKQGFHNLAYSSSPSKADIDNNHINRMHHDQHQARPEAGGSGVDPNLYIMEPGTMVYHGPPALPSAPPIHHLSLLQTEPDRKDEGRFRDSGLGNGAVTEGSEEGCRSGEDEEEERESGLASTPEYLGDTADEESVLSADIHTSSPSLSSAETKQGCIDITSSPPNREEREEKDTDCQSVTDSMVAEALAALEAATAGEDYE